MLDHESLRVASEMCRLTDSPDLLAWLGVGAHVSSGEARSALDRQRRRLQSMQGNPKHAAAATFLIKNYRRLDEVLGDVEAYVAALREERASSQLPLLEVAIAGVLADGVLTPEEAAFVRDQAMKLGIAEELFNRVLRERCQAMGIVMPEAPNPATLPPHAGLGPTTGSFKVPMRTLHMAHRTAGTGWWDDAFTRLLARHVPPETRRLVDFACGLGWTALSLLPLRPELEYLGVDASELHVDVARRNLQQLGLADRAIFQQADPTKLPLPDQQVDGVTCIMSLQQVPDSRPVFREAWRVLRPGGRFVVVEPDCLSQQFWFEGTMAVFNEAFRALCARADALMQDTSRVDDPLGQPGIALGPLLPGRMRAAGLDPTNLTVHLVQTAQHCTFASFARRLRKRVDSMSSAASMRADDPVLREVNDILTRLELKREVDPLGTGVHTLPLFVCVGAKS